MVYQHLLNCARVNFYHCIKLALWNILFFINFWDCPAIFAHQLAVISNWLFLPVWMSRQILSPACKLARYQRQEVMLLMISIKTFKTGIVLFSDFTVKVYHCIKKNSFVLFWKYEAGIVLYFMLLIYISRINNANKGKGKKLQSYILVDLITRGIW